MGLQFFSKASLPAPSSPDAAKRAQQVSKQREDYEFSSSNVLESVVLNKGVPRAELPTFGWLVAAVSVKMQIEGHLSQARTNLRALVGKERDNDPAYPGRALRTVTALGRAMRNPEKSIESDAHFRKLRQSVVKLTAEASKEKVLAGKTTLPGGRVEFDDGISEPEASKEKVLAGKTTSPGGRVEFDGGINESDKTQEYRAAVDWEEMTEAERAFMENFDSDRVFARARVAGLNPMALRRVGETDVSEEGWMLRDEHLQAVCSLVDGGGGFETDTVLEAIEEKRLFMVSYPWLEKMKERPEEKRYVYSPVAVFCVPGDENCRRDVPLVPVAIWIRRAGEDKSTAKLYLPGGGSSWQIAKLIVQVADGNDHEYFRHLSMTHLLLEPFAISLHRNLHHRHPLHRLLIPHFEGTVFINNQAMETLINPSGPVDRILITPIELAAPVLAEEFASINFNNLFPKVEMEARGVLDASKLDFPYRDYALDLWEAVHAWVSSVVFDYYENDSTVSSDHELQSFASEVASNTSWSGFGDDAFLQGDSQAAIISTRPYLTDVVTMLIFTASCQHAALNFPQKIFLSYVPAWPLSMRIGTLPEPVSSASAGEAELEQWSEAELEQWSAWFPPLTHQETQFSVNQFLGGVYHTQLGRGYSSALTRGRPGVSAGLRIFQESLRDIEDTVDEREKGETVPYNVLRPSNIPASTNI